MFSGQPQAETRIAPAARNEHVCSATGCKSESAGSSSAKGSAVGCHHPLGELCLPVFPSSVPGPVPCVFASWRLCVNSVFRLPQRKGPARPGRSQDQIGLNAETQRNAEKRREKELSAILCESLRLIFAACEQGGIFPARSGMAGRGKWFVRPALWSVRPNGLTPSLPAN